MAEQKTNQAVEEISVTKSDLRTIFWRSFCHEASYNAERQQALGFAFTLTKLLKKLYKDDKEAYVEACKRHTEFFNLTVQITNFVVGIVTALEEKNAKSQDKNMGPTISAVKWDRWRQSGIPFSGAVSVSWQRPWALPWP